MLWIIRNFTKPSLSYNTVFREKINLNENEKTLTFESETLNNFFLTIAKKLEIPKFDATVSIIENIKDHVFKAISTCKNHHSILAIQEYSKSKKFISKK